MTRDVLRVLERGREALPGLGERVLRESREERRSDEVLRTARRLREEKNCFLKNLSGLRKLTTFYLTKNYHRWVTFLCENDQ